MSCTVNFNDNVVKQQFLVRCQADNVKFTVKGVKASARKPTGWPETEFNFTLTAAPPPPSPAGAPPPPPAGAHAVPPIGPQIGDRRMVNNRWETYQGMDANGDEIWVRRR